jgi:diaminopimelate decarboxylase
MLKEHFGINEKGHLTVRGYDAVELAERFGTPLYVMDEDRIRENYRRFKSDFSSWPKLLVCYAYKANNNMAICKILQQEGAGAEVASLVELKIALKVGVPPEKIIFNGPNKTEEELREAVENEVLVNLDSMDEFERIVAIARRLRKTARIGFRVNPNIKPPTHPYIMAGARESKFGLDLESGEALEAYRRASITKEVRVEAVHCHIGSQILEPEPFIEEARKIMEFVAELSRICKIEKVDFGGGVGIPYKGETPMPLEKLGQEMIMEVKKVVERERLEPPTLVLEPGRYLVADAGVLLLRVGAFKERTFMPSWVYVDAGMNALIRPALYGSYHHIELANRMNEEHNCLVNVAGPLCETSDVLGWERRLPRPRPGDIVAVFDVGAYGLSMSNQHTAHPRPAVVLVSKRGVEVIRERETFEDLTRLDRIPAWLI